MTWVPSREIDFPPRNQHRFIARVWAREIVLICNEPMVVQQIATLLTKLSFQARLADFFSEHAGSLILLFLMLRRFVILITH